MSLQSIVDFFNHSLFTVIGGLTALYAVIVLLYRYSCMLFGISPIVFRIGKAIWKRKIAIIGKYESIQGLKEDLLGSGIFSKKNILQIPLETLDKCKDCTVYIVDWGSANEYIDEILSYRKNYHTSVIIYAAPGIIPQDKMLLIANKPNTIVVNFRGRLLNDLLNSLVTTSF